MKFPKLNITFEESVDYCILVLCGAISVISGTISVITHTVSFMSVKTMETASSKLNPEEDEDDKNKGEGIVLADMKDMSPIDCTKSAVEIFKASFSLGGIELINKFYQKRNAGELEGEVIEGRSEDPQTKLKKAPPAKTPKNTSKKSPPKKKVVPSENEEDLSSTSSTPASSEVSEEEKQVLVQLPIDSNAVVDASEALTSSAEDSGSNK